MPTASMTDPSSRSSFSTAGSGKSRETRSTDTRAAAIAAGVTHHPLRLTIDRAALVANWRWLAATANTACGAAIKADGYGLGARDTLAALADAGGRDFFVSTWAEAG